MATFRAGRFALRAVACVAVGGACLLLPACSRRSATPAGTAGTNAPAQDARAAADAPRKMSHAPGTLLRPPAPFRVALEWLAGARGMPAVLRIRLLPPARPPRHRLSPPADDPPAALYATPGSWKDAIGLTLQDSADAPARPWTSGWRVVAAPAANPVAFAPGTFHEASCVVDAAAAPPPGARVTVTVRLGNDAVSSTQLTVPAPPDDPREARLNGVSALIEAGDTTAALRVAQEWITTEPARHEGYWCRGLALESAGDAAGALAAFRDALERYPKPDPRGAWEPPVRLWRKLDAVSAPAPAR